jgi:acyl dehydratase
MNVSPGTSLPEQRFEVDRAQLVRYAGASGDFNTIHWSEQAAAAAGLPDVLAHGMLTMALAGRIVTDWLGDPGAVMDFRTRFSAPLPIPADAAVTLTGGGEVKDVFPEGTARIELYLRAGETALLSRVEVLVRTHPPQPTA